VVRVTGEDLLSAIKLLEQHPADEQMRPCHRSERHDRVGAIEDRGVEPFGTTDSEGKLGPALITPTCDTIGQSSARPSVAALVEGNKRNTRRQRAEDQVGLTCFNHHRREPAPLLELEDDGGWDDPASIKRLELPKRAVAELADGEKAKPDRACPGLLPDRFTVGQGFAPHFFEIVVGADLGPEQVHDHVTGIDQHPIRVGLPFDRGADAA
jgi:hypothetical protein